MPITHWATKLYQTSKILKITISIACSSLKSVPDILAIPSISTCQ